MLDFFWKKRPILLSEIVPRGFLSNYITILTSLKQLLTKDPKIEERIFISPTMFSLYGHPSNWFAENRIAATLKGRRFNTMKTCTFGAWPSTEQLNFGQYRSLFPYNNRIETLLKTSLSEFKNTLGVHYRGTDYFHTDRVGLTVYLETMSTTFEAGNYEQIYIATDEKGITEQIVDYFLQRYQFKNIIYNDSIKSSGSTGVHFSGQSQENKILLGDQVLLDAHSIASCKTVVCSASNIINYARILNPELHPIFVDTHSTFRTK